MSRAGILAIGFLVLFVGGGARFAIGLTLKSITEEFAIGRTVLGLTVAVYLGVTSACMFLAGRLADRLSVRAVLVWGLIVSAGGMSLMGLMSAPWQLFGALWRRLRDRQRRGLDHAGFADGEPRLPGQGRSRQRRRECRA